MSFKKITIAQSPSIAAIAQQLNAMQDSVTESLTDATNRIKRLETLFNENPIAANSDATSVDDDYTSLIINEIWNVSVHPWLINVGEGEGVNMLLSAPNAMRALADTLNDSALPNINYDALILLFDASNPNQLAASLTVFNQVFKMPDLLRVERRAQQIATLDDTKLTLPTVDNKSQWVRQRAQQYQAIAATSRTVNPILALSTSAASDVDPLEELTKLINKKQQRINDMQAAHTQISSKFTGDGGNVMRLSGAKDVIAHALREPCGFGHDRSTCAATMFLSEPSGLTLLTEFLGATE